MADMRGTGVVRNIYDMKGSGVVCDESCGCPSPCPGGITCRCYTQSETTSGGGGEAEHKKCSCGEHCGCNPCTACNKSGTAAAGCKCGPGCSCTSCT